MTRPVRLLLLGAGHLCVGIAVLGAFVAFIPSTLFLLLAAACYLRGSEKHYRWLVEHPVMGALIRDYLEKGALPPSVKVCGLWIVAVWVGFGLWRLHGFARPVPAALLLTAGLIGAILVLRIPTLKGGPGDAVGDGADAGGRRGEEREPDAGG